MTIAILAGGVFLFSKSSPSQSNSNKNKVSDSILVPNYAEVTSGIANGKYQPKIANALVTLVEFGDYQCPACGAYNTQIVINLLNAYAGKINYVFRDFAFIGPESARASIATYCAADQNKYWEFHEYLYSHQNGENKGAFSDDNLKLFAKNLNLDTKAFNDCLDSSKYQSRVDSSLSDGKVATVDSTPSFFINGVKINNPATLDEFKTLIDNALKGAAEPSSSPAAAYHMHFDLKAYVNGTQVDFSQSKYQESKTNPLDANIHFHDGNGDVVHVHKNGIALSELFNSLKISFPGDNSNSNLKVYVNGSLNSQGLSYIPLDIDQILVSYGPVNDTNITSQISSVTNNACIYSLKCPSRGTPPPEDCVGGLGTGCTD